MAEGSPSLKPYLVEVKNETTGGTIIVACADGSLDAVLDAALVHTRRLRGWLACTPTRVWREVPLTGNLYPQSTIDDLTRAQVLASDLESRIERVITRIKRGDAYRSSTTTIPDYEQHQDFGDPDIITDEGDYGG